MSTDLVYRRMQELEHEVQKTNLDDSRRTLSAMAEFEQTLKRIQRNARDLPAEWQVVEMVQARGPVLQFRGRLLADTTFETRRGTPLRIDLEIWETEAASLVAMSASTPAGGQGREDVRATVVERQVDEQAMHFAVMDHFDWADRARSMVRKLGWSLRRDVA